MTNLGNKKIIIQNLLTSPALLGSWQVVWAVRNLIAPNPSRKMMRMKKMIMRRRMQCPVASACAYVSSWRPFASYGVLRVAVRPPRRDVSQMVASPRLDSLSREELVMLWEVAHLLYPTFGVNVKNQIYPFYEKKLKDIFMLNQHC